MAAVNHLLLVEVDVVLEEVQSGREAGEGGLGRGGGSYSPWSGWAGSFGLACLLRIQMMGGAEGGGG